MRRSEHWHGRFRSRMAGLIPALALLLATALPVEDAQAQTTCPTISGDNSSGGELVITTPCTITSTGKVRRSGGVTNVVRLSGLGRLTIEKGGLIERTGNVTTSGHSVLRFDSRELTVVNRGTIRSTGTKVLGVEFTGSSTNDGTFENWGTVETRGASSTGIRISAFNGNGGERNTVINRGLISTQGTESSGILSHFNTNTKDTKITNFGRILVAGNGSNGIAGWDENVVITLEADSLVRSTGTTHTTISGGFTTMTESTGLSVSGSNAKVNIKAGALVETTGNKSRAVQLSYDSATARVGAATLTVGGTVRATGTNSFGIRGFHDDATINILAGGLVETTGSNSSALYFGFDGQKALPQPFVPGTSRFPTFTVSIAGTVRATGSDSYAIKSYTIDNHGMIEEHNTFENITVESTGVIRGDIHLGGNTDTLTIRPGARIFGKIHLGAGSDVLKYGEAGKEVSFKRHEKKHFLTYAKGKRSQTYKYTVYGVQGASAAQEMEHGVATLLVSDVDNSTGPAMLRAMAGDAAHAVQGAMVSEALSGTAGRTGWVSVGGNSRRQKGEEFDHKRRNLHLVGGVEMVAAENWQVGFAAGAWNGKASADPASIQAKGSGAGAGIYTGYSFGDFTVSGSLLAGRNKYEARRGVLLVNNENADEETETAVGSSKGKWIGASIGAAPNGRYALDFFEGGWSLKPQVVASWVRLEQDEITEKGATDLNLKTDARKDRILVLDGEVGIARPFAEGTGEVELLAGVTYQRRSGDNVTSSLDNSKLDQAIDQGASETDIRLGVDVRYALSASSGLDFGVDYSKGKDKASGYSAAFAYRIGF